MKNYYCYGIVYDTDGENVDLETEMLIEVDLIGDESDELIKEEIADTISSKIGFCVQSFDYELREGPNKYYYTADIFVRRVQITVEAESEEDAKDKIYSNPFDGFAFEEYDIKDIYFDNETIRKI